MRRKASPFTFIHTTISTPRCGKSTISFHQDGDLQDKKNVNNSHDYVHLSIFVILFITSNVGAMTSLGWEKPSDLC